MNIHYPNETKNVYDYVYKPKTETETDNKEKAAQLTETESIASSNEPESPKDKEIELTKPDEVVNPLSESNSGEDVKIEHSENDKNSEDEPKEKTETPGRIYIKYIRRQS